jgi:hypothetical protein
MAVTDEMQIFTKRLADEVARFARKTHLGYWRIWPEPLSEVKLIVLPEEYYTHTWMESQEMIGKKFGYAAGSLNVGPLFGEENS